MAQKRGGTPLTRGGAFGRGKGRGQEKGLHRASTGGKEGLAPEHGDRSHSLIGKIYGLSSLRWG